MTTSAAAKSATNHGALKNGNGKPVSVFDLDAYAAEALHEPFTFSLAGQQFDLPHMADMDWHASFDKDGNLSMTTGHQMLRLALGEQWEAFDKLPLRAAAYNELQRRWHEHSGIDLGEGPASQP